MTRDEMKNKISLALKDPLLQQGFEVICKENAVLKDKIGMLDLFCGGDSFKQRRLDTFIQIANYIEKLEKENAELKGLKDVATLIRANNDTVITLMQLNNMLVSKSQQLTKAKEIINKLIELVDFLNEDNVKEPIIAEAEQFISEVEK